VLDNELARKFDLSQVLERPMVPYGQPVQLGDKKGIVLRRSPEEEALQRWTHHEFLEVERGLAKQWRNALMRVNHDDLVKTVKAGIGHWRKPKSLEDAKQMADYIIDNMDPEWLIGFGLELLALPEATQFVRDDWTARRKPPIRQHLPIALIDRVLSVIVSWGDLHEARRFADSRRLQTAQPFSSQPPVCCPPSQGCQRRGRVTKIAIDKRAREGENKGHEESLAGVLLALGGLRGEEATGCGDPASNTEPAATTQCRTHRTLCSSQAGKCQHGDLQLSARDHRDRFKNGAHQASLQENERGKMRPGLETRKILHHRARAAPF
jgi:hypothetical protein